MTRLPYKLAEVTAPTEEPITFAEWQQHARVSDPAETTLVESYIVAARRWCEDFCRRAFVTQTHDLFLECWPSDDEIIVPKAPLQSVTTVQYKQASDGVLTTLASSGYQVDANGDTPGRIRPAFGESWPVLRTDVYGAVEIRFVCGYGAAAAVPDGLKHAIRLLATHWYEAREPIITGTIVAEVPLSIRSLLWMHRADL